MYEDLNVEKLVMDLSSLVNDIELALQNNPAAVKREIGVLHDSYKSLGYTVGRIIARAS